MMAVDVSCYGDFMLMCIGNSLLRPVVADPTYSFREY
jgi:hypothetical protein